jgi:hypothetical protein
MNKSFACVGLLVICSATLFAWTAPENIGYPGNTGYMEISPTPGADNDTLYIASRRSGGVDGYDIWKLVRAGGVWAQATCLPLPTNTVQDDVDPFYRPTTPPELYDASNRPGGFGGFGRFDLWFFRAQGSLWINPTNLGSPVDTTYNEHEPCIVESPTRLYFTSMLTGNADIYLSYYSGAAWQSPTNLGLPVNTDYNETGVFVIPDGSHMYFSSDRPGGFGGYALYEATYAGGSWGNVQNMGAVINTTYDEISPCLSLDGNELYFACNRPGGYGQHDIWVSYTGIKVEAKSLGALKALFK